MEHLSRSDDGRVAEIALVDHAEQVHILHDVQIVVGRRAVRAERDIDAALEHLRHVRIARGQLEVARRAARDRHAVSFQNIEILVLEPDAVRRRRRRIKDAVLLHVRRRGQAVAAFALLVLGLRLGQMDLDARTGLTGVLRDRLDDLRVGGILAVDAQITDQTAVVRAVPLAAQAHVVAVGRQVGVVAVVEHGQAAAQIALDAALEDGRDHAAEEKVHIRERRRAAREHLRDGEQRAVVGGLVVDLILEREYLLPEPALERQILRVAAQQRHGRMAVDVVEGGHEQAVAAVIALAEVLLRRGRAYVGDAAVLYADILISFRLKLFVQQVNVAE